MRRCLSVLALVVATACSSDDPQDQRGASLDQLLTALAKPTGRIAPAVQAAHDAARASVAAGGDEEGARTFVTGAWRMLDAARVGHSGLFVGEPGNGYECTGAPSAQRAPYQMSAQIAAPAVPTSAGFLVQSTRGPNPLDLHAGDTVVRIAAASGTAAMTDLVMATPSACGPVYPSDSGRQAGAARVWYAFVAEGTELEIVAPDGAHRVVVFPDLSSVPPVGPGSRSDLPTVGVRADGVTVLTLPSFSIDNQPFYDGCAQTAGARALVIDVRGNPGGNLDLATGLAGSLPGAHPIDVIRFVGPDGTTGVAGPTKDSKIVLPDVPTAILVDGLSYSAASVLVRFARPANVKIVGLPDAAAYTNYPRELTLPGPPELRVTLNEGLSLDIASGDAIEGVAPAVDTRVEMNAADMAKGIDTQLEAAAALVRPGG